MDFRWVHRVGATQRTVPCVVLALLLSACLSPLAFAAETDAAGAGGAEDYLSALGLTADKVACLRQKLGQDYGGLSE